MTHLTRLRAQLRRFLERGALGRRIYALARRRHALKVAALQFWSVERRPRWRCSSVQLMGSGRGAPFRVPPLVIVSSDGSGPCHTGQPQEAEAVPRYVREVLESHILGGNGVVLTARRRFVTENLYGSEQAALAHGAWGSFARSLMPARERLGPVFVLQGPYSHNYFHWLNDHLPRVEDFLLWREGGPAEARILVTRAPFPWQLRSLELLGVGPRDLVTTSETHARSTLAAVSSHPGYLGKFMPAAPERLTWLRARLLKGLSLEAAPGQRRIYVSRRDSARRTISNEREVELLLESRGFEAVALSEIGFDDQVRLFHDAGTVVGAHGAGLSNLLFSTRPRVIELMSPEGLRPDFFHALTAFVGGTHTALALRGTLESGFEVELLGLEKLLDGLAD